jgi:prophage regulatory protein
VRGDRVEAELVSGAEIGRRLGISRERVRQLTRRADFPVPLGRVGPSLVWRWDEIDDWRRSHRLQPSLTVRSSGVRFATVAEQPGFLEIVERDGTKVGAVAWAGAPITELEPIDGGVLVRTARLEGEIRRNMKGYWTLQSAVHTVPRGSGWANQIVHGQPMSLHRSHEAAVREGQKLARKGRTEHVIHGRNGRIVARNSYGRDEAPRRGRER